MNHVNFAETIISKVLKNIPDEIDKICVETFINEELSFIDSFNGIKVLNSTKYFEDGVFIYYRDGFVLVSVKSGIAKTKNITDEIFVAIMVASYTCKYLSLSQNDYSKEIKKFNKKITQYL